MNLTKQQDPTHPSHSAAQGQKKEDHKNDVDVLEVLMMVLKSLAKDLEMPSLASAFYIKHPTKDEFQITFFSEKEADTEAIWSRISLIGRLVDASPS